MLEISHLCYISAWRLSHLCYNSCMMWTIETHSEAVDDEIAALSVDFQARFLRTVEMIQAVGLERMTEPHVKHLEGKIWEIRLKGADGIARLLYVTRKGRRIVIVHAFVKKTQKTPRAALNIARKRAEEVKDDDEV